MILDGASGLLQQVDIDDVVMLGMCGVSAVFDRADVVGRGNDSFRKEKASGQLTVGTWRAHDHGKRASVQPHFQRFLDGCRIFAGLAASASDAPAYTIVPLCAAMTP